MMKDKWLQFPLANTTTKRRDALCQYSYSNTQCQQRNTQSQVASRKPRDNLGPVSKTAHYFSLCFYLYATHNIHIIVPSFCQLSKPSGYFTCSQVQQYKILRSAYTCISEQTTIISPYNINGLVFITETECLLRGTNCVYLNRLLPVLQLLNT
jgi:hypothetical protein